MEYLDHIVSHNGVKVDPNKIKAMREQPIPNTLKKRKGFLGLRGYCHKFVKNYCQIATALTKLLNKEAFSWTKEATKVFEELKEEMCTTPIMATPNFPKIFIVECDASVHRIDAILMQE